MAPLEGRAIKYNTWAEVDSWAAYDQYAGFENRKFGEGQVQVSCPYNLVEYDTWITGFDL